MAKYLYITGIHTRLPGEDEWNPAFRHVFIEAKDEDDAYTKGSDIIDEQLLDDEELAFNDLVIKLP